MTLIKSVGGASGPLYGTLFMKAGPLLPGDAVSLDAFVKALSAGVEGVKAIGVTAGASAPEVLVQSVITRLRELGGKVVAEHPGREPVAGAGSPRAGARRRLAGL